MFKKGFTPWNKGKRICLRGHDTSICGRYKDGSCKFCIRDKVAVLNKTPRRKEYMRNHQFKRLYNISCLEYDRLYQVQQGQCAICRRHQTELKAKFFVDHDHNTGLVRGLLCPRCNTKLSGVEDVEFFSKAQQYLRRS